MLTIKNERYANGKYWLYEYIHGKVYNDCDYNYEHLFDEKQLILLPKLISKYHQFLIRNSSSLSTNRRKIAREHLLKELKQSIVSGVAKVLSQTEQEVFHLIVDEIILCTCEDFTFIYWQYQYENEQFQGIKALAFYYKRALWHAEHALKK
ncbi:unnamed protein product [Rotaria magnacalcarata]|uniref:Uncharacterized protein n=1 Tax=Rotaria magnacalcarata TaxID=392030 RepID=A0A820GD71_9BILA|nr:unnamed protein product [Rotaria magnacalcarata]CAF4276428.1 unnamed protein product [Rotaria magnacalcarata]